MASDTGRLRRWWRDTRNQDLPTETTVQIPFSRPGIGLSSGGLSFLMSLALLVFLSVRYSLNVGYLLLFNLTLLLLVGAAWGKSLLSRLSLKVQPGIPIRAGSPGVIEIEVAAPKRAASAELLDIRENSLQMHAVDVDPHAPQTVRLDVPAMQRGVHPMPSILIQTRRPFGLWRVFVYWKPGRLLYVYPEPEAQAPLPPQSSGDGNAMTSRGTDELHGLKPYRMGDPLRAISWRTLAKTDGRILATLQMSESRGDAAKILRLEDALGEGMDLEQALRRLCAWLHMAHERGDTYALDLGDVQLPLARGQAHFHTCLEKLAGHRATS